MFYSIEEIITLTVNEDCSLLKQKYALEDLKNLESQIIFINDINLKYVPKATHNTGFHSSNRMPLIELEKFLDVST